MIVSKIIYHHAKSYSEYKEVLFKNIGKIENKIILEAGCGSASNITFVNCEVYGIDISQSQLDKNQLINYKILGDLNFYKNSEWNNKFDLIVCWDVLEHLRDPIFTLKNFSYWLKKDGKIILAFPNQDTILAKLTKFTPLWVHYFGRTLTYLLIQKNHSIKNSWRVAKESTFPTVYNNSLKLNSLLDTFDSMNLEVELFVSVESDKNLLLRKILGMKLYNFLTKKFISKISIPISPLATDFLFVLKKSIYNI